MTATVVMTSAALFKKKQFEHPCEPWCFAAFAICPWRACVPAVVTAGRQTLSSRTHECLSEIRSLLLKIESLQAEVVHIYVDASSDREKYSGLGGMVVDMSKKTLFFERSCGQ